MLSRVNILYNKNTNNTGDDDMYYKHITGLLIGVGYEKNF
jgi:hypothetical protein